MVTDTTPQQRIVRLLLLLVERPYFYTRAKLEEKLGVGEQTVRRSARITHFLTGLASRRVHRRWLRCCVGCIPEPSLFERCLRYACR